MNPIDTYRDAFLKFLADGLSHAEALEQFNEDEWNRAAMEEVFSGQAGIDILTHKFLTKDERRLPALFELRCIANYQRSSAIYFAEQAVPLMLAGWTSEVPPVYQNNSVEPYRQCPTMSLYWRAPSKRPGKPGRRYLSTQQAFNAMKRGA